MSEPRSPLRVGLACHAQFGGSVVVATELAIALAERGHEVHVFASDVPPRLDVRAPRVHFHAVQTPPHPLFPSGEYGLALASKITDVARAAPFDVMHVHYGIPHATSAFLAKTMLAAEHSRLRVVVTLHGTDVMTLGVDPAFHPVLRHSVLQADAVTVPSKYLKHLAEANFAWPADHPRIHVVGNSVDTRRFHAATDATPDGVRSLFGHGPGQRKVLVHNSNFRALKRTEDVVRVFAQVRQQVPALLLFIGDGPTRPATEALANQFGLGDVTRFVGSRSDIAPLLQMSDVFMMPSEAESFGLAALEALACGVPVVATRVGGLPELLTDGVTGFLHDVGDVDGMSRSVVKLLQNDDVRRQFSTAARADVEARWRREPMVDQYEAVYRGR